LGHNDLHHAGLPDPVVIRRLEMYRDNKLASTGWRWEDFCDLREWLSETYTALFEMRRKISLDNRTKAE
jgi:hypothetical protein